MILRLVWIVSMCLVPAFLFAQENDSIARAHKALLEKHLKGKEDVTTSIHSLLESAKKSYEKNETHDALYRMYVALMVAKQVPPSETTFELNMLMARFLNRMNSQYALEYFNEAIRITQQTEIPAFAQFDLFTNKAGVHMRLGQNDSARHCYHLASLQASRSNPVTQSSAKNNVGVYFLSVHQQDSARAYLEDALSILGAPEKDMSLHCAILDNLAQLDLANGKFPEAIRTFTHNDSVYRKERLYHKYTRNKLQLIETLDKMQDIYVDTCFLPLAQYIDQHAVRTDPQVVSRFYRFAVEYALRTGDKDMLEMFHRRLMHLQDSIAARNAVQADALASTLLTVQQSDFSKDLQAHQLELRNARLTLAAILVTGLLIVSLLLMYIRKKRQTHHAQQIMVQAELREKEMQARLIAQELELKKKDLTNVVLHNTHVYDANQKVIDRLHDINVHKGSADEQVRALLTELQQQNQINDRSIGLLQNIQSVNAEFYEKLRTQFPSLTKAESELCGYIRINLSSKDISILKNVEAASVKMGKNRLRKKLGLMPEDDLYAFVQAL